MAATVKQRARGGEGGVNKKERKGRQKERKNDGGGRATQKEERKKELAWEHLGTSQTWEEKLERKKGRKGLDRRKSSVTSQTG